MNNPRLLGTRGAARGSTQVRQPPVRGETLLCADNGAAIRGSTTSAFAFAARLAGGFRLGRVAGLTPSPARCSWLPDYSSGSKPLQLSVDINVDASAFWGAAAQAERKLQAASSRSPNSASSTP